MAYKAPIWEDGKSPAISAENLNNLSQAAEGAQVLYGNSAPTSSTEGAVGQFYLVVVADSDGNYPLYQCVAIANGSYTWRDTRRIPDSITSMLGIPAPGTINSALNVLANIGNVHVWSFTDADGNTEFLTSINPDAYPNGEIGRQDAGYTLESPVSINLMNQSGNQSAYTIWKYADSVVVSDAGAVSLSNPSTANISASDGVTDGAKLKGKFVYLVDDARAQYTDVTPGVIYFIPSDAILSGYLTGGWRYTYDKAQQVIGYPATNAGEYTYLGQLGGGARIEVGSYVGTGTKGRANPNSLTFGFEPKLVIVGRTAESSEDKYGLQSGGDGYWVQSFVWVKGQSKTMIIQKDVLFTQTGNTLSWYSTYDAASQCNSGNSTYTYLAIG